MTIRSSLELRERPMSRLQVGVIGLCSALNVLDGFDLQSVSFVAPILTREWHLSPGSLGILFSLGLAGIAVGAPLLAVVADLRGRRTTILICLVLISASVLASSAATSLFELALLRVSTGIGIGGMLASINTVAAEFASDRRRDLAVSITQAGFPIGGTLGGILAVYLVAHFDWRAVFLAFGALTACMLPIVHFLMPESIDYLAARQPPNALQRINQTRQQLSLQPLTMLGARQRLGKHSALRPLLGAPFRHSTILICLGFFVVPLSFYFLLSWMPKLLVDFGFSLKGGISSAVFMNLGGIVGGIGYGFAAALYGRQRVAVTAMVLAFAAALLFGFLPVTLPTVLIGSSIVGVFIFAAFTSLYALVPNLYPAEVRASGTGVAMGVGRVGALLGPYIGGLLIAAGMSAHLFLAVMTLPFLAGALIISRLPRAEYSPPRAD